MDFGNDLAKDLVLIKIAVLMIRWIPGAYFEMWWSSVFSSIHVLSVLDDAADSRYLLAIKC